MKEFEPTITIDPLVPSTAVVEMRGVGKSFKSRNITEVVLENFSLKIADEKNGEFIAILGPSGCGKSTIINLIGGLSQPSSGEIISLGKKVDGDNPNAVTVQQAYTCLPWRTVQQNVEFGLEIRKVPAEERTATAKEYLEKVGLGDRGDAYPKELSGGMQQRVVIARCLAMKPKIMLMDEPFGALDAKIREDMQLLLLDLWEHENNCIIFVTHDITEALLLADRVVVVAGRPANIVADMKVPFPRPRADKSTGSASLTSTPEFQKMSREILDLLKGQKIGGQVRVSL